MALIRKIDLFCRVVDNYGDIGVCWRLARQLASEHGRLVTLWIDDLHSFRRICAAVDPLAVRQQVQQVNILHWVEEGIDPVLPEQVGDLVVEGFGCALPTTYIAAMAQRQRKPVWINLEYLSAESWVEAYHMMVSLHPSLPLKKYFFFPGFSDRTGGLLAERDLVPQRRVFQSDEKARQVFLSSLSIIVPSRARLISLFCYPSAPVSALLASWQENDRPIVCVVPEGVARDAVENFLGQPAQPGARVTKGALTLQVLPFIDQTDYDKLLWTCDFNFVRGEDSFVRAQWAARPFIWHIYPQEEAAHRVKLEAFLMRYFRDMDLVAIAALKQVWNAWNADSALLEWGESWATVERFMPSLQAQAQDWEQQLWQNGDLASNLICFVEKIG